MKLHKYKLSVKIIQIRKENLAGAEWKSGCGGALIREVPKQFWSQGTFLICKAWGSRILWVSSLLGGNLPPYIDENQSILLPQTLNRSRLQ